MLWTSSGNPNSCGVCDEQGNAKGLVWEFERSEMLSANCGSHDKSLWYAVVLHKRMCVASWVLQCGVV